ncbi:CRAL-TRIO domain-containing protein [Paraphysoderma sedebokerense]|nr:CRAL-TRIO domain-containing protein [Paraphysoderma sedebokerense]
MVANDLKLPTWGRLGHLTAEESKALAETWLVLLDFWYSNPEAPVDINTIEKEYSGPELSNGKPVLPSISRDTAPPIISTRTPKVITRAFLRQSFWLYTAGFHPSDVLLRFLRARQFDTRAAVLMLLKAGLWRSENQLQALVEKGERIIPRNLLEGESFNYKTDKIGRPVLYINVRLHQRGANSQEEIENFLKYSMETGIVLLKAPADAVTLIFNMNGMTVKNMDLGLVKYLVYALQNYYPESLGVCLIVDAPWIFNGFWKVIQGLLDPKVKEKVKFVKMAEITDFIDAKNLPQEFGGSDPYSFKYTPPSSTDMARRVDKKLKKQLLAERMTEVVNVEQYFAKWAVDTYAKGPQRYDEQKDKAVLEKLVKNFWDFDEATRFPTFYHRIGAVNKDVCDWSKART